MGHYESLQWGTWCFLIASGIECSILYDIDLQARSDEQLVIAQTSSAYASELSLVLSLYRLLMGYPGLPASSHRSRSSEKIRQSEDERLSPCVASLSFSKVLYSHWVRWYQILHILNSVACSCVIFCLEFWWTDLGWCIIHMELYV